MFDVLSGCNHSQGLFHGDHLRQAFRCAGTNEGGWVDWVAIEDEQELEGTRSSMSNQLRDLAKEKELREKRLNEEAQSMAERQPKA